MNFPKKTLREIVQEIKGKSVLDIGSAGQGNIHDSQEWLFGILRKKASEIKGIDPEPCEDKDVIQAGAEGFELNHKFEVITMFDVIEHLDNVGLALKQIKKHLQPKGKLILTTPNITSIGPVLDILLFRGIKSNPSHTLGYNKKMIQYLLKRNSFQVLKIKYLPYPLFGNHQGFKKILYALRCIGTYPFVFIWKEFSPTLYVVATPKN